MYKRKPLAGANYSIISTHVWTQSLVKTLMVLSVVPVLNQDRTGGIKPHREGVYRQLCSLPVEGWDLCWPHLEGNDRRAVDSLRIRGRRPGQNTTGRGALRENWLLLVVLSSLVEKTWRDPGAGPGNRRTEIQSQWLLDPGTEACQRPGHAISHCTTQAGKRRG